MIAALACSVLFLTSYLIYHAHVGSKPFLGTGPVRTVYFTILITHTILAAAVPFLAILTVGAPTGSAAPSTADRPLDAADLALRLGDGSGGVLDAVPDELVTHPFSLAPRI